LEIPQPKLDAESAFVNRLNQPRPKNAMDFDRSGEQLGNMPIDLLARLL
jgi:hypothetical protein